MVSLSILSQKADQKKTTHLSPTNGIRVLGISLANTPFAQCSLTGFDSMDGAVEIVVGEVDPSERDGGMSENVTVDGDKGG